MNSNPYNLPRVNTKNKKSKRQQSYNKPIEQEQQVGRRYSTGFKIIIEQREIELIKILLQSCTDPKDQQIKTICERVIQAYENRPNNSSKPLVLNQATSDIIHGIFKTSW
jgi:hypothetical protein